MTFTGRDMLMQRALYADQANWFRFSEAWAHIGNTIVLRITLHT